MTMTIEQTCRHCDDDVMLEDGVWTHVDNRGTYVIAGWRIVGDDGDVETDGTHHAEPRRG